MKIYEKITKGTGIIDHYVFRHMVYFLIKIFGFRKIHPNWIVLFNLVFAGFCAYLISIGDLAIALIGSFLFIFFDMFDLLDGAVARVYGKTSKFGGFFDGLADILAEILILISVGIYFSELMKVLYLLIFILVIIVINLRIKWILEDKEVQINLLDLKVSSFMDKVKYLVILATRNDSRKIIIFLGLLFSNIYLIIIYFVGLYFLSMVSSLGKIIGK
ncbi:hypothetical protein C0585_07555 [Candidatus Woesearchaeota archaeon]|nr:MAG: hypothetical protein C0585_07555 [Candidatus Woesearchaeota archaeon]